MTLCINRKVLQMKSKLLLKFSLMLTLMCSYSLRAETLQDVNSIEQVAHVYAMEQAQAHYGNPQVVTGNLDPRLRLQQCSSPLTAFNNSKKFGLGSQVIGVKCRSDTPWTVYVPVTIKLYRTVVVAARPLNANRLISSSDIKLAQIDISTVRKAYFKEAKLVIGQQIKYPVVAGAVLNANNVRPQKIVRRGETITLIAEAGSMQVRMTGMALSDAVLGERIRVENSSSKRIVEGVVDAPGQVKISM